MWYFFLCLAAALGPFSIVWQIMHTTGGFRWLHSLLAADSERPWLDLRCRSSPLAYLRMLLCN